MNADTWRFLRALTWDAGLRVAAVVAAGAVLSAGLRWLVRRVAERAPARLRLPVLRAGPIARLLVLVAVMLVVVPALVEPSLRNVIELAAAVGVLLAFALKDWVSSLIAGLATVLENTYQPGDWIAIGGSYGEVRAISLRAVRIVTPDDTEVVIPHAKLWSEKVANATSGSHQMLCVADFYLDADHDGAAATRALRDVAEHSTRRQPDSPVKVIVTEKPWGTQYKLKAYVAESREQFDFITDLTLQGKQALRALKIRFARAPLAETMPA